MVKAMNQTQLLGELDQVVAGELDRHEKVAREWFPHDYVPWSQGRDFDGLMGGDQWSESDADISDVARSALIVNLLTEDNLPSYHHEIATTFGRDRAWGAGNDQARTRAAGARAAPAGGRFRESGHPDGGSRCAGTLPDEAHVRGV